MIKTHFARCMNALNDMKVTERLIQVHKSKSGNPTYSFQNMTKGQK